MPHTAHSKEWKTKNTLPLRLPANPSGPPASREPEPPRADTGTHHTLRNINEPCGMTRCCRRGLHGTALAAEMGAQAAQPSWQLPTLPPDIVGGAAPGETGWENTSGGLYPSSSPAQYDRGTTRPGGNASARGSGVMAEGLGVTLLSWGDIVGGVGVLQWGQQQKHRCGVGVGMFAVLVCLFCTGGR